MRISIRPTLLAKRRQIRAYIGVSRAATKSELPKGMCCLPRIITSTNPASAEFDGSSSSVRKVSIKQLSCVDRISKNSIAESTSANAEINFWEACGNCLLARLMLYDLSNRLTFMSLFQLPKREKLLSYAICIKVVDKLKA